MKENAKKKLNALVAIEVILAMTLYYFVLIGQTFITYAIDSVRTNAYNVDFCAYFLGENGEKQEILEENIDKAEQYLYVDISVKNEGYFNGKIKLDNNNFNLKQEVLSTAVSSISGNEVTLGQINAGTTATVKLGIEAIQDNNINLDMLNKTTDVILQGQYVNSKNVEKGNYTDVNGKAGVTLKLKSSENTNAELSSEVLTNSLYNINGEQKRVVQILVNSRITNNNYPIKNTEISLNGLGGAEKVEVHTRGTNATNSNIGFDTNNYTYDEKGNVDIKIQNEDIKNISWNKNANDTLIITYIFNKEKNVSNTNISIASKINTYDEKEITAMNELKIEEEKDGKVSQVIETKEDSIYKGKIYTGEEREYEATSIINVDFPNVMDNLDIKANGSSFLTPNGEIVANIVYKQTRINKNEFLKIFGEEGYITFKSNEGTIIANINKDSEIDENGEIVINYSDGIKNIELITSKPKDVGTLNIKNIKTILNNNYSRNIVDTLTAIKESETINNIENTKDIILKETSSQANINMDVKTISTMSAGQEITLEATLETNDESKDLYKNPTVVVTLPKEISEMSAKHATLYKNGLEVENVVSRKNANGEYQIEFKYRGEQLKYDSTGGTKIYIKLQVQASKLTPSKTSSIKMTYTNENKNQTKETSVDFKFESQYGLMSYSQIANYNNEGDSIYALNGETAYAKIDVNEKSKEIIQNTALINNYEDTIANVTLIGTIPFENNNNAFKATLNKVETNNNNCKIYYSENPNAIAEDNSWKETAENAVSYKIVLNEMKKEEILKLNTTITIPENIQYNKQGSLLTYSSCNINDQEKSNSSSIVLTTESSMQIKEVEQNVQIGRTASGLDVSIVALSGNEDLSDNEEIYEGQTIRYKVTVSNNTDSEYSDVEIKATQKNGYVWDWCEETVKNYYYGDEERKEHFYEITNKNEITLGTLESLKQGETYTFEYEAQSYLLNNESLENKEKPETYGTISIIQGIEKSEETIETIKNAIKEAGIKAELIQENSREDACYEDSVIDAYLNIYNLTENAKNDVMVKFIFSNNLTLGDGEDIWRYLFVGPEVKERLSISNFETNENGETIVTLKISSINGNEILPIGVRPHTKEIETEEEKQNAEISAQVQETQNMYYSNNIVREFYAILKDIDVNQEIKLSDGKAIDYDKDVLENGETVTITGSIINKENAKLTPFITYELDSAFEIESAKLLTDNEEQETDILTDFDSNYLIMSNKEISTYGIAKIVINAKVNAEKALENEMTTKLDVEDMETGKFYTSTIKLKVNNELDEDDDIDDMEKIYPDDDANFEPDIDDGIDEDIDPDDDEVVLPEYEGITDDGDGNNDGNTDDGNDNKNPNTPPTDGDNKNPSHSQNTYNVSGTVWMDKNKDGKRTTDEENMKDIEVKAINSITGDLIDTTKTNENGTYTFNLSEAEYIIAFLYNDELYNVTTYHADGAGDDVNSDAIRKQMQIDGRNVIVGATDSLKLKSNLTNIDIGLILRKQFDLKVDKYVSKITVTNDAGTKTYEQKDNTSSAKIDIHAKNLNNSLVIIEYKIKVTNIGEVEGYAKNIVDYKPSDLSFKSSLNSDWYQSGENLYSTNLANTKIAPGETKELKLILTKTMTESNTGLVNNKAKITKSSNDLGIEDDTDNEASANVIISISTGVVISYISTIIIIMISLCIVAYLVNRKNLYKNKG